MTNETGSGTPGRWGLSVTCGVLGWVLDAYSFFVPLFLLDPLADHFGVSKSAIVATVTITLVMRPVGAFLFGWLSDRAGRKFPLLICVLWFSIFTGFMPIGSSFTVFVLLRALYGVGLGGYWGIGAALVMETCPSRWRGLFSGILQAGYSVGYLFAAVAASLLEPKLGWSSMFVATPIWGSVIILLLLGVEDPAKTPELHTHTFRPFQILRMHWRSFAGLTILMTIITCLSHGTQDLYPDFLKIVHGYDSAIVAKIAILYNVGAALGAIVIGRLSDRIGRTKSVFLAVAICVAALPAWAFGRSFSVLAAGSFAMQVGVQGAFGVMPAYLNERSPAGARSLFAGLAYQSGMVFGAPCVIIEYAFKNRLGYGGALAAFEGCVFVALTLVLIFTPERRTSLDQVAAL